MSRILRCCLFASLLSLIPAAGAFAEDGYRTGRISDLRGGVAVRGAEEDDVSYVEVNSVLREGDVLWTDENGRAEIELERGSWVRLADETKVEMKRLGASPLLQLWSGSLYCDVSDRIDGVLRVKTPVGDVDIRRDGVLRVDVASDNRARVSLHHGEAEAFPERGEPLRLAAGDRIYLESERPAGALTRFDRTDLDSFDRYHRERVDYWVERPVPRELDEDIVGSRELRDHGSWVNVDNNNYWRPRAEPDWRPYSNGYWSYMPGFGMTWVDYSPWGYTTSHYGRWMYRPVHGWLWAPGFAWGPSYVYWGSYGSYCGWAPLDPWGRPCYYGPGNFSLFSVVIDHRSWSYCDRDRFYYGRHHRNFANHGGSRWGNGGGRDGGRDGGRGGGGYSGRYFHRAEDLNLDKSRFSLVRDINSEVGVPRDRVRGLTFAKDGAAARDRVASFERRIPEQRQAMVAKRFGVSGRRDLDRVATASGAERYQRDIASKLGSGAVLRGQEAVRRGIPDAVAAERSKGSIFQNDRRPGPLKPLGEQERRGRFGDNPTTGNPGRGNAPDGDRNPLRGKLGGDNDRPGNTRPGAGDNRPGDSGNPRGDADRDSPFRRGEGNRERTGPSDSPFRNRGDNPGNVNPRRSDADPSGPRPGGGTRERTGPSDSPFRNRGDNPGNINPRRADPDPSGPRPGGNADRPRQESRREEPRRAEPRREEPRKEEPRKEEPRKRRAEASSPFETDSGGARTGGDSPLRRGAGAYDAGDRPLYIDRTPRRIAPTPEVSRPEASRPSERPLRRDNPGSGNAPSYRDFPSRTAPGGGGGSSFRRDYSPPPSSFRSGGDSGGSARPSYSPPSYSSGSRGSSSGGSSGGGYSGGRPSGGGGGGYSGGRSNGGGGGSGAGRSSGGGGGGRSSGSGGGGGRSGSGGSSGGRFPGK